MNPESMSERLFTLANGVTTLGIVLSLLFVLATTDEQLHAYLTDHDVASLVLFAGIFMTAALCLSVWFCYLLAYHDAGTGAAWFFTSVGRTIAILIFGFVIIAFGDMHRDAPALNYSWLPGAPVPAEPPANRDEAADDEAEVEIEVNTSAPADDEAAAEGENSDEAGEVEVDREWRTE